MPLSNNQERVERSLYHKIRSIVIEEGFNVDLTTYLDNVVGFNQMETDVSAIKTLKGYAIDVFGVGASQSKKEKKVPRIALNHRRNLPGEIGLPPSADYYERTSATTFNKIQLPTRSSDIYIDVHLVSKSAKQDRKLHEILEASTRVMSYIPYYDVPSKYFFVEQVSHRDIPNTEKGIIEKIYTYKISDIYLHECKIISNNIASILCINLTTQFSEHPDIEAEEIIIGDCDFVPPEESFWVTDSSSPWEADASSLWQLP